MKQARKEGEFLLEIGTEEIPSSYLEEGLRLLVDTFKRLPELRGKFDVEGYQTPCRFILHARGLPFSFEKEEEIFGPPKEICYQSDGKPTPALEGFLKRHQTTVKEIGEEGGRIVLRRKTVTSTRQSLLKQLPLLISALSFPKLMRWEKSGFRFPRPIRWVLSLYDGKALPFSLKPLRAGTKTYGGGPVRKQKMVRHPKEYFAFLKRSGILLEKWIPEGEGERRRFIREQLEKQLKRLGGDPRKIDQDLLREVTNLVEVPLLFAAGFDRKYLSLPKEILIASMAKYQRVFSVEDSQGRLLPHFVACANGSIVLAKVRKNYEQVLNARLEDAAFFYAEDSQKPFSEKRGGLKLLVYHQKLGTMHDKSERMKKLASHFVREVRVDEKDLLRACELAKNDLLTEMVKEFPSLQGVMGYYYAKGEGETEGVSRAIWEQYLPKGSDAKFPTTPLGAALSFVEKLDHLVGCFYASEFPTGSVDPYGLRRAANAVFRILLDQKWKLSLTGLIGPHFKLFSSDSNASKLQGFLQERLKSLFREKGFRTDLVDAVVTTIDEPVQMAEKLSSLSEMMERRPNDFLAAYKVIERTNNILKPLSLKEKREIGEVKPDLFQEELEKRLWDVYNKDKGSIQRLIHEKAWTEATAQYGHSFSEILHQFFEKVLVNVENRPVRQNRLVLMKAINELYTETVADLAKLQMNR